MLFNYKSRTKEGKIESGTIKAYSKEAAIFLLHQYDIFIISLEEQGAKGFFKKIKFNRRVSKKDLAIFFRQLSVMLESRVPVVQALLSLASQVSKTNFKETIFKISGLVEQGVSLSEAFAAFPKTFNNFHVNLVKSGEASGRIASVLYYISENLEREDDIASQIRHAMVYPVLIVSILFVVIGIVVFLVMPKVAEILKQASSQPPPLTIFMLNSFAFLQSYWWILLTVFILLIIFIVAYAKTKKGRRNYNKWSLKVPLVGDLLKKVFLARFCGNISTLLIAGVSINRAFKITEDTVDNIVYKEIISKVGQKVSEGEKMSAVMEKYQSYFPYFVIQMIRVGEETGKLDKVLIEVVKFYQKEIARTIDLFSRLVEPVTMIVLGIIVSVLAFSVFSSIYGVVGSI